MGRLSEIFHRGPQERQYFELTLQEVKALRTFSDIDRIQFNAAVSADALITPSETKAAIDNLISKGLLKQYKRHASLFEINKLGLRVMRSIVNPQFTDKNLSVHILPSER